MKGGITKKLEDTVLALDKKQLKKALYLTDREGMERQHEWVKDAARTCLSAEDKKGCESAVKGARDKIVDTITPPLEETSLEGLEEYLGESSKPTQQPPQEPAQEGKSDEELYESCEECHVATAVVQFAEINKENPSELATKLIEEKISQYVEPEDWIKNMIQVCEGTEGEDKEKYCSSLGELVEYLEGRDSPILKKLDEE